MELRNQQVYLCRKNYIENGFFYIKLSTNMRFYF